MDAEAAGLRRGDALRLRQVLANLASNAVKFTEAGGVTVRVSPEAERVAFEVADTGVGIPADRLDDIFEKFAQVDTSSTRRFGGTGLGLAICRELVARMGGEISVVSAPGEGSAFRFTLPLNRAAAPAPGQAPDACDGPVEEAALRILVADDNEINRQIVSALLEPFGAEVTLACDGREAVEAFARAPFDLVLMDIQMPGMNGVQATRAIRTAEACDGRPSTPILALSANVMTHQVAEYLAAGMNGIVPKPIEADRLVTAIRDAFAGAADDEEASHAAAAT
jgi:CheY-like chemotaxis protein/anti-sigma regulatory factor (Ser/Thr protein kinase)